jgi:hypothetical protein
MILDCYVIIDFCFLIVFCTLSLKYVPRRLTIGASPPYKEDFGVSSSTNSSIISIIGYLLLDVVDFLISCFGTLKWLLKDLDGFT